MSVVCSVPLLILPILCSSCCQTSPFSVQLFLKSCISQSGTKIWDLASGGGRRGAQGEAGLGAQGRMGPGAWTVPSQHACVLLGLGVSATAFTLRRPSLMPESGVYVCTVPSLSDYGVFLDCCSNPNTALQHCLTAQLCGILRSRCQSDCCQCRWPCCIEWQQELLSSFSFLVVSSCNQTKI